MYNLAVSQFHQESPQFLYFSSHIQPLSYAEALLASEYGSTVLVAFPDEARNLVLVSLPLNLYCLTEELDDDTSVNKQRSDKLPQQVSISSREDPPLDSTLHALGNQLVSLYCGTLHRYRTMFSVAKMHHLSYDYQTQHLRLYLQGMYSIFKERLDAFMENHCQMGVLEIKRKEKTDLAVHYYKTLFQPYSEKLKLHIVNIIVPQVGKNGLPRRQVLDQCTAAIMRFGEKKGELTILGEQGVSRYMERLCGFLGRCDTAIRHLLKGIQVFANFPHSRLNQPELHLCPSELTSSRYLSFLRTSKMIYDKKNETVHREGMKTDMDYP